MSGEKASSPCGKFQANIFNQTKCQNCFKSRELHLLSERHLEQVRPVYGGWLCLAPEGTDFSNPVQRSRKWQRRFFILYEDGGLSFALDELPSTLPQGSVSMALCTDIADAEPRTGQRNALCLVTPQQEIFIRGDNKEIISGWSEQLAVYLQTSRQSQKKRKVEPVASQEPSPAKISATERGFPSADGESGERDVGPDDRPVWTITDPQGNSLCRRTDAVPSAAVPTGAEDSSSGAESDGIRRADRSCSAERLQGSEASRKERGGGAAGSRNERGGGAAGSRNERGGGAAGSRKERGGGAAGSRKGRSDARSLTPEKQLSAAPPPHRRSKSLDRRTSDTIVTPDLLNFKKGWMVRLDGDDQWKKSWFVLSADSLRYYKDSVAEESSDLEGEIDLSRCFSVTEFQVQRNYGFQIHTPQGVFTLSAMTAGIRRNWIQALMKNVQPAGGRDAARTPEVLPKPDVTQDSPSPAPLADPRPRRASEWAEFRPGSEPTTPPKPPCSTLELLDAERRRRREERRRRYEDTLGVSLGHQEVGGGGAGGGGGGGGGGGVQALRVEEEMEECWRLVERMVFRAEKAVPLTTAGGDWAETEAELLSSRQAVEDLKVQLAESERSRLKVEAELGAAGLRQQQLDCLLKAVEPPSPPSPPQLPSIWLQDTKGNLQEVEEALRPAPASGGQHHPLTPDLQDQLGGDDLLQVQEEADDSSARVEVRRLSREVELLNQRNQEMLNQLTEADREIERLKAELNCSYTEPRLLPEAEQQEKSRLEEVEAELSLRNQELLEAQALIASLEDKLRVTEALLQETEDPEDSADKAEGHLLRCFEAKLTELETQLRQSEQQNVQLREAEELHLQRAAKAEAEVQRLNEELETQLRQSEQQDAQLREVEELHRQRAAEAEADVQRLNQEVEQEKTGEEEKLQQVMEAMLLRLRALGKWLEVADGLEVEQVEEQSPAVLTQLKQEEKFWSSLLQRLKELQDPADQLLAEVTELMMMERQLLLHLLGGASFQDVARSGPSVAAPQTESGVFASEKSRLLGVKQTQISLLSRLASSVTSSVASSVDQPLWLAVDRLHHSYSWPQLSSTSLLHSAATEALYCWRILELRSGRRRCGGLASDASCQTLEEVEQEAEQEAEEEVEQEPEPSRMEEEPERRDERDLNVLVSQLTERLRQEFEVEMSRVRVEHQRETEKLKVTCERGFSSMEEAQLKVVEELQRRHQQEVERLLLERDRLLEEESAATATAIQAIKEAHRLELQREAQRRRRRSRTEGGGGQAQLEEVYRLHSEELASYQRQLEVLSQQFSLKCLENRHLVQALDAERKALCQCQQENQDLRTRNQELSGLLAAEITRLCSLAKRAAPPLGAGTDPYEMEITLRVKESEVQCLQQQISSLKEELQSAHQDKRNATKKYKDTYTELSIVRAKAQRDADELRENLRLAHQALGQSSP